MPTAAVRQSASAGASDVGTSISATFSAGHGGNGYYHTFVVAVLHDQPGSNVQSISGITGLEMDWTLAEVINHPGQPLTLEVWVAQKEYGLVGESARTLTANFANSTKAVIAIVELTGVAANIHGINPLDKEAS